MPAWVGAPNIGLTFEYVCPIDNCPVLTFGFRGGIFVQINPGLAGVLYLGTMKDIRLIEINNRLHEVMTNEPELFESTYQLELGLNAEFVPDIINQTVDYYAESGVKPPWGGFLVVDNATSHVVGTCAYKGAPDSEGRVEIAYFTFPAYEGRGYATAMAGRLLERAIAAPEVHEVLAHTLPERNASCRVLEKTGLKYIGEVDDPVDGKVWRWQKRNSVQHG